MSGTKGMDDNKTLAQARFVIGDYIDIIKLFIPLSSGKAEFIIPRPNCININIQTI